MIKKLNFIVTRMHSSRMRTSGFNGHMYRGCVPGGGGVCPGEGGVYREVYQRGYNPDPEADTPSREHNDRHGKHFYPKCSNQWYQWRIQDFPEVDNPKGWGGNPLFGNFFVENCIIMKKRTKAGVGAGTRPFIPHWDPPMISWLECYFPLWRWLKI